MAHGLALRVMRLRMKSRMLAPEEADVLVLEKAARASEKGREIKKVV